MKQPKALYLLAGVQMWEYFSFYGMRALLVLYMIHRLQLNEIYAFGVYAAYSGFVELGGVAGGIIADRFLGLRKTILLGGWLIAAGHTCMAIEFTDMSFYLGLALIVVGSCLFTTNISALLGLFYEQADARREEGYTLFYVVINFGGLLSTFLCGIIGERFGWHYGFGLAAIGMLMGNLGLLTFNHLLQNKGNEPALLPKYGKRLFFALLSVVVIACSIAISKSDLLLPLLPWVSVLCIGYVMTKLFRSGNISLNKLITLGLYLGALAIFFAAEEQIGSSLLVFSEKFGESVLFGFDFPSSSLLGVNPLTIILIGPFLNRLMRVFTRPAEKSSTFPLRIVLGLFVAALAFGGLSLVTTGADSIPFLALAGTVLFISVAELLVAPTVFSYCSEVAPESEKGEVMGLIPIGFSLASFIAGHICICIAGENNSATIAEYQAGFANIGLGLACASLFIGLISALKAHPFFNKEMAYEK